MKINFILLIIILLLIVIIVLINKDSFISQNNIPSNDGKMKFDYLTNPNYSRDIINKYYLNDDSKTNGIRNVYHKFQQKNNNFYGNPKYLSLIPWLSSSFYTDLMYKTYGIRI